MYYYIKKIKKKINETKFDKSPKDIGQRSVAGKNINWYFTVSNLVFLKSV